MAGIQRVTPNLLNILNVLLTAHERGETLHGAGVVERSGESTAVVYPALRRLADERWLDRKWANPETGRQHRICRLTSNGVAAARGLLDRPEPHPPTRP